MILSKFCNVANLKRNVIFTTFSQQILGGGLLLVGNKANFNSGFNLKTCNNLPLKICCECSTFPNLNHSNRFVSHSTKVKIYYYFLD